MKKYYLLLLLLTTTLVKSQIIGNVVGKKGEPLPYVSVYLENTAKGTTTNNSGAYELKFYKKGSYVLVFQFIGLKTVKKEINIQSFPYRVNAKLIAEEIVLDEVMITSKENPADKIIRSVIVNKDQNTNRRGKYTADFYSRGLFKITNAPKKFLGQELGDFGGGLDYTIRNCISFRNDFENQIFEETKQVQRTYYSIKS